MLNGSTIQRASTFPSQAANLTILSGGSGDDDGDDHDDPAIVETSGLYSDFSLRGDDGSAVVVDCSDAPKVENVTATAFAGEYGAGQRIYFQVQYGRLVSGGWMLEERYPVV